MESPSYAECARALQAIGLDQLPAEFHGQVCGLLCRGDAVDTALSEVGAPGVDTSSNLHALGVASLADLAEPESRFAPLLPEDETALHQRVVALADWCEGFLHGLALRPGLDLKKLSAEARELIEDFTQISRAGLVEDDDEEGEDEERAYAELVEYVRVGVQVLFLELTSGRAPDSATLH